MRAFHPVLFVMTPDRAFRSLLQRQRVSAKLKHERLDLQPIDRGRVLHVPREQWQPKSIVGLLALAAPLAWSSTQSGLISEIRVASRSLNGIPTHIMLNSTWTGRPTCATTGWWAIDTDTTQGKNFYAALLEAQTSAKQVTLLDSNDCSLRGDMETVWQLHIGP